MVRSIGARQFRQHCLSPPTGVAEAPDHQIQQTSYFGYLRPRFGPPPWTRSLLDHSTECRQAHRDAVPLAVERRYDSPKIGGYLGNVG